MTPQEIYNTVAVHLFTQGERAGIRLEDDDDIGTGFSCRYRAPGGKTCAVGKLLPDDCYEPGMEDNAVDTLCAAHADTFPSWMIENVHLLDRLQTVHDTGCNWKGDVDMKFALGIAADKFGLDKSILDGLSFNRAEA